MGIIRLTYHTTSSDPVDRPARVEIDITPAMKVAGAAEFLACRSMMTETAEDAAVDIFTAMMRALREPSEVIGGR